MANTLFFSFSYNFIPPMCVLLSACVTPCVRDNHFFCVKIKKKSFSAFQFLNKWKEAKEKQNLWWNKKINRNLLNARKINFNWSDTKKNTQHEERKIIYRERENEITINSLQMTNTFAKITFSVYNRSLNERRQQNERNFGNVLVVQRRRSYISLSL